MKKLVSLLVAALFAVSMLAMGCKKDKAPKNRPAPERRVEKRTPKAPAPKREAAPKANTGGEDTKPPKKEDKKKKEG